MANRKKKASSKFKKLYSARETSRELNVMYEGESLKLLIKPLNWRDMLRVRERFGISEINEKIVKEKLEALEKLKASGTDIPDSELTLDKVKASPDTVLEQVFATACMLATVSVYEVLDDGSKELLFEDWSLDQFAELDFNMIQALANVVNELTPTFTSSFDLPQEDADVAQSENEKSKRATGSEDASAKKS